MFKSKYSVDGTLIKDISHGSEKKVEVICDECGKEYTIIYHNYILSQKRRNNDGLTICLSCSSKINSKKNIGRTPWNKGNFLPLEQRSLKPYISSDGYRMVPNDLIRS